jgi:hypothetical protein
MTTGFAEAIVLMKNKTAPRNLMLGQGCVAR